LVNLADEREQRANAQRGGKECGAPAGSARFQIGRGPVLAASCASKRECGGRKESAEADCEFCEAVQLGPVVGEEEDEGGGEEGGPEEGEQSIA